MRLFDPKNGSSLSRACPELVPETACPGLSRLVPRVSGQVNCMILNENSLSRRHLVPGQAKCLILNSKQLVPMSPLTGGITAGTSCISPRLGLGQNEEKKLHPMERIFHPGKALRRCLMSDVNALILELEKYGARLVPAGHGMLTLANGAGVPGWLRDAVKEAKVEILASFAGGEWDNYLFNAPPPTDAAGFHRVYGKWPWEIDWMTPHTGRRSLLPEVGGGILYHWCPECGRWASFGFDVDLPKSQLGSWHCFEHRPTGNRPKEVAHGR